MELITWTDDMSTKINEIDEQHKFLIKIINRLFNAMLDGEAFTILDDIIDNLVNYTNFHFSTEEGYLEKYNYENYESHKVTHNYFIDEINNFKKEIKNGKNTLSIEVFNFLKDWLTDHILNEDMKYSRFLVKQGAK